LDARHGPSTWEAEVGEFEAAYWHPVSKKNSFWRDENVLKLIVVMTVQFCDDQKS
jgi:hypothetical protein